MNSNAVGGPSNDAGFQQSAENLWEKASASLNPEIQDLIKTIQPDRREVLELCLKEANKKRQECLRKRWKIKKPNGDVIILRDVFEKIIKWVDKFKSIADSAMYFAPAYASIPWGIVSVVITSTINDSSNFAAMIDGVERITGLISRYAIFEVVYFQNHSSGTNHLKVALTTLYASILEFLDQAYQMSGQSAGKRFMKATFLISASNVTEQMTHIEVNEREVERTAQLVGMELLLNTSVGASHLEVASQIITRQLEQLSSRLVAIEANTSGQGWARSVQQAVTIYTDNNTHRIFEPQMRVDDVMAAERRRKIFDWLSSVRYKVQHLTERKNRLPESGRWMFESPEYQNWMESSISGTLWLHGIPGCGKTKLASAVIDAHIEGREQAIAQENAKYIGRSLFAYFYCSRNKSEPERADPDEILRSIARQLCGDNISRPVNEHLSHFYRAMENLQPGEPKLSQEDTVKLILQLLAENPSIIVIDALDECDADKRYSLFENIDRIVRESLNVVKVFLTSRNDGDIVCRLNSTPNIYINASKNSDDIRRFVLNEVEQAIAQRRMLNGGVSLQLQSHITEALDHGAKGMFRWVSLQVQNLCDPRRMKIPEDIVRELGNLPKSLRDLYSLAFSQVTDLGSTAQQIALNALKLTMFCIRPICWDEFLDLLSSTHGLNRVPTKSEVLDMTFNFLEDDEESNQARFVHLSAREYLESRQDFSLAESSLTIAMLCIDSIRSLESNMTNKFSYSAFSWPKHLSYTTTALRVPAKEPLEELLRPGSRLFAKWRKTIRSLHDTHVLTSKKHLKNLDDYNKLPLVHTTEEALLSFDRFFAVCIMGLEEFVPLLSPTRFNIAVRYRNEWNNLAWAAEKAIDAYNGKTCLEMAVLFNRISVIRKFHELGFDLSQQLNTDGETLLHVAAKNGTSAMAETLLTSNMDPNRLTQLTEPIIDYHLSTSDIGVHRYPGRSSTSMGFRTNQGGKWGILSPFHLKQELNAPIHFAVARQDGWHITKVLIEHKADVNIRTSAGNTALQLALNAGKAKDQIIDLLLQAGADPNADLGQGQVLLHRSAAMGLEETVQLLLKAGANSRIKDFFGQTPYDLARRYGSLGITEILEPELPTPQPEWPESPKSPEASSELTVPSISVDEAPALDSTTLSPSEYQTLADTERLSRHRRSLSNLVAQEWRKLRLKRV